MMNTTMLLAVRSSGGASYQGLMRIELQKGAELLPFLIEPCVECGFLCKYPN